MTTKRSRSSSRDLVARAGFFVTIITDPRRIHSELAVLEADVIVLDLMMPDLDGVLVLRALADKNVSAGVVLVSGADVRTVAAAEVFGKTKGLRMIRTVAKPFDTTQLLELLRLELSTRVPLTAQDLEIALREGQLGIEYLPTIARSGSDHWNIESMEALLRWEHPDRGLLAPAEFLALGENSGLIRPITDFVIQQALSQLKRWQLVHSGLGLRINVSAALLTDISFPDRLELLVDELAIDPTLLTIEIVESETLAQNQTMLEVLTRLRNRGIKLALDDFGIGYSSLTQLFAMPFTELKIDRSLLSQVPESSEACIMVHTLVELAHNLKLTVCAEGVESEAALSYLERIACDSAQGFFIGRPMSEDNVEPMLNQDFPGAANSELC